MKRLTPESRQALRRVNVPPTLTWFARSGSSTERGTLTTAASLKTASTFFTKRLTRTLSRTSPLTNLRFFLLLLCSMFSSRPVKRLSRIVT